MDKEERQIVVTRGFSLINLNKLKKIIGPLNMQRQRFQRGGPKSQGKETSHKKIGWNFVSL